MNYICTTSLCVLALVVAEGCVKVNDPSKQREETNARVLSEHARDAETRAASQDLRRQRTEENQREKSVRLEAESRKRLDAHEAAKAAHNRELDEKRQAECDRTREVRDKAIAAYEAELDKRNLLVQWELSHCAYVDRSVPVIRTIQDSRGEFHTVEGRSEAVRRECDAPLPSGLKNIYARDIQVISPMYDPACVGKNIFTEEKTD